MTISCWISVLTKLTGCLRITERIWQSCRSRTRLDDHTLGALDQRLNEKHRNGDWIYSMDDKKRRLRALVNWRCGCNQKIIKSLTAKGWFNKVK